MGATGTNAGDGQINAGALYHMSRDPLYRSPVGAVPLGTMVTLRLKTAPGDLTGGHGARVGQPQAAPINWCRWPWSARTTPTSGRLPGADARPTRPCSGIASWRRTAQAKAAYQDDQSARRRRWAI